MMMSKLELTEKIKQWMAVLPEDEAQRISHTIEGAEILLRITRNRILYANAIRNPAKYAEAVEYQLKKIYQQRLETYTHQEVTDMMAKVKKLEPMLTGGTSPRSEWQSGKRTDHDQLPEEIKQLYVDNADLMRRMREAHTRLRLISPDTSTCPDNDRYTICKYLLDTDKQYRDNWNIYDHYVKGTDPQSTEMAIDRRTASSNAAKLCNLLLGHYAKRPTEELAERIKTAYSKIDRPTAKLMSKMTNAQLL